MGRTCYECGWYPQHSTAICLVCNPENNSEWIPKQSPKTGPEGSSETLQGEVNVTWRNEYA